MTYRSGRHFLQLPGPTNIPDRILRAMSRPTIDHRGPEFARFAARLLEDLAPIFETSGPVFIYPGSATGGWEAAMVNTLSPGDKVLVFDHGFFGSQWAKVAERLGLQVEKVPGDWRRGLDPAAVEEILVADANHDYRALMVVHNETSTGVTNAIADVRAAVDRADHPALLFVDAVSSLGSMPYHHDEWRVDVTVTGSQKGLMLPPGLSFNAVSQKALDAAKSASLPKSYWDWNALLSFNETGYYPYTPATNLLFGLEEALAMFREEGMGTVFARHRRFGEATRRAVSKWGNGLKVFCTEPERYSSTVTTVQVPDGADADELRTLILDRFDMSLGGGLGKLKGQAFRIGHIGDLNDLTLAGTLCGVEMGLAMSGLGSRGGVDAALDYLAE